MSATSSAWGPATYSVLVNCRSGKSTVKLEEEKDSDANDLLVEEVDTGSERLA